jgi:hypothetical protein
MTGLVPYMVPEMAKPTATAFTKTGYTFYKLVLIVAILAGYTSCWFIMGQSRVFYDE